MTEDLRALAERWIREVWNERRDATIDELMAPHLRARVEGVDTVIDRDDYKAYRRAFLSAIPDMHLEIQSIAVDGNVAVVNWRFTGTHTGPGLGIRPSGRSVDFPGIGWMEFGDGQIVGGFDKWNHGELIANLATPRLGEIRRRFGLTKRESEVAILMADRMTHKEIARDLGIRPNTARRHGQRILEKLGLHRKEDVREALGIHEGLAPVTHGSDLEPVD